MIAHHLASTKMQFMFFNVLSALLRFSSSKALSVASEVVGPEIKNIMNFESETKPSKIKENETCEENSANAIGER